jgi:hypothetical protein
VEHTEYPEEVQEDSGWDYREILGRYRRFGGARVRYVRSGMRYAGMGDP